MGIPTIPNTIVLTNLTTVQQVELSQLENNVVDAYFQAAKNEIKAVLDETENNLVTATKSLRDIVKKYDLNIEQQEIIREDLKYEIHYVINFEGLRDRIKGFALKRHLEQTYP